jgi:lipoprotein LprG
VAVRRTLAFLLPVTSALLVGCSGGSSSTSPQTLLDQATSKLNATSGVRFALSSSNIPKTGLVLVGGNGEVARPNAFRGKLQVQRSGLLLSIDVVSVAGTVYIRLPLTSKYAKTDPHQYGFSDPGKLIDPTTGINRLLTQATDVRAGGRDRFNGEKLTEVKVTLPGETVADVLASADKTKPVQGTLGINPSSHELRRAVLTGPFLDKNVMTTFTIVLDHYGEHPSISVPS